MAYDMNILRGLAANPTAYPGAAPSPAPVAPGGAAEGEKPEPVALAELAQAAKEALADAAAKFAELTEAAEVSDLIDPKSEKTIAATADGLARLMAGCEGMCEALDAAAAEHSSLVDGKDEPPPPAF